MQLKIIIKYAIYLHLSTCPECVFLSLIIYENTYMNNMKKDSLLFHSGYKLWCILCQVLRIRIRGIYVTQWEQSSDLDMM